LISFLSIYKILPALILIFSIRNNFSTLLFFYFTRTFLLMKSKSISSIIVFRRRRNIILSLFFTDSNLSYTISLILIYFTFLSFIRKERKFLNNFSPLDNSFFFISSSIPPSFIFFFKSITLFLSSKLNPLFFLLLFISFAIRIYSYIHFFMKESPYLSSKKPYFFGFFISFSLIAFFF